MAYCSEIDIYANCGYYFFLLLLSSADFRFHLCACVSVMCLFGWLAGCLWTCFLFFLFFLLCVFKTRFGTCVVARDKWNSLFAWDWSAKAATSLTADTKRGRTPTRNLHPATYNPSPPLDTLPSLLLTPLLLSSLPSRLLSFTLTLHALSPALLQNNLNHIYSDATSKNKQADKHKILCMSWKFICLFVLSFSQMYQMDIDHLRSGRLICVLALYVDQLGFFFFLCCCLDKVIRIPWAEFLYFFSFWCFTSVVLLYDMGAFAGEVGAFCGCSAKQML